MLTFQTGFYWMVSIVDGRKREMFFIYERERKSKTSNKFAAHAEYVQFVLHLCKFVSKV